MVWVALALTLAVLPEGDAPAGGGAAASTLNSVPSTRALPMRTLLEPAPAQLPPISDGARSHTLRAQPQTESLLRLETRERGRIRLVEIKSELFELLYRPSVGEVFVDNLKKVAPWMGIGLIPLAGGLALGFAHVSLTVPLTTEQAIVYPGIGIGAFVLSGLMVVLGATISHFIDEADSGPARQRRVDALRLEREALGS